MSTDRRRLTPEQKNYQAWPRILLGGLVPEMRSWVENRLLLVQKYLDGTKVKDLCLEHRYSRKELHKIVAKCLRSHPDGRIYGERGVLPGEGRKTYTRFATVTKKKKKTTIGFAGAFGQLLEQHPGIRQMILDSVLNRKQTGEINEPRIPIGTALYQKVRKALIKAGVGPGDYPFTTKDQARRSLYLFVNSLFLTHTRGMIKARFGKDAARSYGSGFIDHSLPIDRPYARVQMDSHIIDEIDTVLIEHPWGGFTVVVTERCCVVILLDVGTRTILGYELVLSSKTSQEDILACIECALTPWKPMELTVPGLSYPAQSGLPSGVFPELVGAQWDETLFDNDWAHLAFSVTDTLMDVVGSDVNAGTAGVPNDRAFIERVFRTFTDRYVKRSQYTTGGHSKDSLRDHPEKKALKYHPRLDHLLQIIDVAVAEINSTAHGGLGGRTSLEVLGHYLADSDQFVRRIGVGEERLLEQLAVHFTRKVQGSLKQGTRPYLEFMGARYTNDILTDTPELIKKEITLVVKPKKDIRQIKAYLPSGAELGIVSVMGPWRRSAHTLKQRREALQLIRDEHIKKDGRTDPIQAMKEYYGKKAVRNKKAAAKYAKLQEVQKSSTMQTSVPSGEMPPPNQNPSTQPSPHILNVPSEAGFVE